MNFNNITLFVTIRHRLNRVAFIILVPDILLIFIRLHKSTVLSDKRFLRWPYIILLTNGHIMKVTTNN